MVDAHESSHKAHFKNRWRAKIFKDDEPKPQKSSSPQLNQDDDVNDFLRPSTEKAQAHAAAFLSATKPRIDVAAAQRWPGASEILRSASARDKSPGIGGMRTPGKRKKGLTVSFARTTPDVIGHGGDECEEPSIEVYRRRKSSSMGDIDKPRRQVSDDMHIGTRTFNGDYSVNREAERRGIVTRTLTSHGELSPPLQKKMEMGNINTHAEAPAPPPRGLGQMGLSERPRALQRAPTGFDVDGQDGAGRPSMDSTYSFESDNLSPAGSKNAPSLPGTIAEEDDFRPKALQRSQTGWSEHQPDSDDEPPAAPTTARLPEMDLRDDASLQEDTKDRFLQSEPADSDSFSAKVIHKMRAEEGKALHEAALRRAQSGKRNSDSSSDSFQPGSTQPGGLRVGTPPSQFNVPMAGKTPPRVPSHEPPPAAAPSQNTLDADYDPFRAETYRSRARGPSPARRPMPPGSFPLDTDPRPSSSSSSQYTVPSATSRNLGSPTNPVDPFSATTMGSVSEKAPSVASSQQAPFSAMSQSSIVPTPLQFEKQDYVAPSHEPAPPPPPPHMVTPNPPPPPAPRAQQMMSEAPRPPRQEPPPPKPLVRSDTKSQGEIALMDFADRVTHMKGIFQLTAQLAGSIYDHTPMQWLRVAIWWFLRGRTGMENLIRSRPKSGEPQPERLTQPHVDLAKAWWILTEVVQNHPQMQRGNQFYAEAIEAHGATLSSLKMLLGSMKRHHSMPPTQALIQGQDQSIWVEYPPFAPDVHSVLSGTASKSTPQGPRNPANSIPLGDTKIDFCYFRMFVTASLSTDDPSTDRVPLPAVVSVLRPREEFGVKLSICSQTELINITIGSNPAEGPTMRDVAWKSQIRSMIVQLRHGFSLKVELTEADFRSLWSIVDHTNRVESQLRERQDERLSMKIYLKDFAYKDSANTGAFPSERVKGCKLMVFEKFDRSTEGTGRRKLHRGYRILVVTSPQVRTLSCVSNELGTKQEPMNFEYTADPVDNAPGLFLRFTEPIPDPKNPEVKLLRRSKMEMFFNDSKERNHLFGTFTSMNQNSDEATFAQVPLKSLNIESADPAEGFSASGHDVLGRLKWMEAKAFNTDPDAAGLESAPTVMSESLRIVCRHSAGVISDRMNLGPGELLVRLPIDGAAELTLLRNPQQDMAVAIDASRIDKDVPDALAKLLKTLTNASTIRRLTFNSFKDLHVFQFAVTGFQVIFDGIASSFSISRRRMVVPIYKQWTANTIRIQVVQQDNIIQLLAFFEEFSHADAMNFQLKSMDTFEKTDKGGKPSVRLVDAKFALPVEERRGEGKMGKEEGRISGWAGMKRRFVCLDQIEYPGEHDDILISFDSVETRDRFAEALPAASNVGRKFTMRRKI